MNGVCFAGSVSEIITRQGESLFRSRLDGKHSRAKSRGKRDKRNSLFLSIFKNRTRGITEPRLVELALLMKKVN